MKRRVILINILGIFVFIEVLSRIFIFAHFSTGPFDMKDIINRGFYNGVTHVSPLDTNNINILMLGGSVLHRDWGSVEDALQEELTIRLHDDVCIVNVSYPSHTSRDSYEKYKMLKDKRYDYVIIYHGINDVFLNNIPEALYQDDYSHAKWYRKIDVINKHAEKIFYATPLVAHLVYQEILERTGKAIMLPNDGAPEHLKEYGNNIKNSDSFRRYIESIITTALSNGSEVILSKFAYYIPDNYDESLFESKKLDYAVHKTSISIWGCADYVERGIESNNTVTMKLASQYGLHVADAGCTLPKCAECFNDICHLTQKGSAILAAVFADIIVEMETDKDNAGAICLD